MGRRVAHRLLRAGAARARHRRGSAARRCGMVVADRCPRRRAAPGSIRRPARRPRRSRRASARSPRKATARRSNCGPRGRREGPIAPARGSMGGAGVHARGSAPGFGRVAMLGTRRSRVADYVVIDDCGRPRRRASAALAAGHGPVAVDVERASGFRYSQRAYLIQVFRRGAGVFLFDPPPIGDFSALQDGDRRRGVGAARGEPGPAVACASSASSPRSIFDTELARAAARPRARRPRRRRRGHCSASRSPRRTRRRTGRRARSPSRGSSTPRSTSSTSSTCATSSSPSSTSRARPSSPPRSSRPCSSASPSRRASEPWRRLSGLHTVRGRRALAVARALWTAREDFAQAQDVAPGRLVPDRALVAAVIADPKSKQDLAAVKEFTGRASRTQLDRWWAAIEAGRADDGPAARAGDRRRLASAAPRVGRPQPRGRRAAEGRAPGRRGSAPKSSRMPTENLLTPELLRRVAWSPPEPLTADVGRRSPRGARRAPLADCADRTGDRRCLCRFRASARRGARTRFVGFRHPVPARRGRS